MGFLVTLITSTVCVGAALLINSLIIEYEDDQPDGWCNPLTTLDIEQIENLELRQLSARRFEISGKSKLNSKKSVIQITITIEKKVLTLLIQQADIPRYTPFLYRCTDEQGNFEYQFTAPSTIQKIILKDSETVLWEKNK